MHLNFPYYYKPVIKFILIECRIDSHNLFCVMSSPPPSSILYSPLATIKKIGDQIVAEPRKRGRPGRKPITELMAEDENSLYFVVRSGRALLAVS